jgi:hypothetical protein
MRAGEESFAVKIYRMYIFHGELTQIYATKKNDDQKNGERNFVGLRTRNSINDQPRNTLHEKKTILMIIIQMFSYVYRVKSATSK